MSTLLLFGCCCHPSDGKDNNFHHSDSGESGSDSDDGSNRSAIFGAFSACAATSSSVSDSRSRPLLQLLWYGLLGGVSGAVGEALPLGIDDNLSMPILSGVVFLTLSACTVGRPSL